MPNLSWPAKVFSLELRNILAYRADFWLNFFGTVLFNLAISYFLWSSIFLVNDIQEIKGMNINFLLFYYFVVPMNSRIVGQAEFGLISQEVFSGGLNKYLLYPLSFLQYVYVKALTQFFFQFMQLLLGIFLFSLFLEIPNQIILSPTNFIFCFLAMLLSHLCYFFLGSCMEMVSFWTDHTWTLMVMLRFIAHFLGGAMVPIILFPEWATDLIYWTPFPYFLTAPYYLLIGQDLPFSFYQFILVTFIWSSVFYGAAKLTWKKGTHQYTGIGI